MPPEDAARTLLGHVIPFTLVLFRMAGVFVMAPMLSSSMIPVRAKALLATTLALATYAGVGGEVRAPAEVDVLGLVPLVIGEILIGLTIGAIASIPLLMLELAGAVMGYSIGFGLARVYNPELDTDTDILGQLLMMIGVSVFVAIGGIDTLFASVARSFERVPVGWYHTSRAPLDLIVGAVESGFDMGLRVAMPVVGVTFLLVVVMGVIGKTMPQINIMTVGFMLKILAGLGALALAGGAIHEAAGDAIAEGVENAVAWVRGIGGA